MTAAAWVGRGVHEAGDMVPDPGVLAHPRTTSTVTMMIIGLGAHLFHLVAAT